VKRKAQMYNLRAYLTLPTLSFLISSFVMIWICAWLIYTYSVKSAARDVIVDETLPILSELFSEAYALENQLEDFVKNPDALLNKTVNFSNILNKQFLNYSGKGLTDALLELPIQSEEGYPDYGIYSINPATGEYECEQESNCLQGRDKNKKKLDYVKLKDFLNYVKSDVKDTIEDIVMNVAIKQAPVIKGIFVNRIDNVFSSSKNTFVVMKKTSGQSCEGNLGGAVKHSSDRNLVGENRSNPTVKNWTTKSPEWSLFSQKMNTESRYETDCVLIDSNDGTLSLWFSLHYEIKPPIYILSSGYGRIVFIVWLIFATMYILILRQGRKDIFALEEYTKSLETLEARQKQVTPPERIDNRIGLRKLRKSIWKLRSSLVSKDEYAESIGSLSHAMLKPSQKLCMRSDILKNKHSEMSDEKREKYINSLYTDSHTLWKLQGKTLLYSDVLKQEKLDDLSKVNMYDLLIKSIDDKQDELKEKEVSVSNTLSPDLCLKADKELVGSILDMALDNAIKYNISGGTVTIQQKGDADGRLDILIQNSGIGMSQEVEEFYRRIFSDLSTSSTQSKVKKGSHGIGLKAIYRIMKLHGGKVSIHPKYGTSSDTTLKLTFIAAGYEAPKDSPTTPVKAEPEEKVANEGVFNPFPVGDYSLTKDIINDTQASDPKELVDSEPFDKSKDEDMRSMITTSGIGYVAFVAAIYLFVSGSLF